MGSFQFTFNQETFACNTASMPALKLSRHSGTRKSLHCIVLCIVTKDQTKPNNLAETGAKAEVPLSLKEAEVSFANIRFRLNRTRSDPPDFGCTRCLTEVRNNFKCPTILLFVQVLKTKLMLS